MNLQGEIKTARLPHVAGDYPGRTHAQAASRVRRIGYRPVRHISSDEKNLPLHWKVRAVGIKTRGIWVPSSLRSRMGMHGRKVSDTDSEPVRVFHKSSEGQSAGLLIEILTTLNI